MDFEKGIVRIERTEYFQPKSEDSAGEVDLDAETLALLRGWKIAASGPFVIESTRAPRHESSRMNYRCTPHFDTLYAWLKKQGITARKPLHELRKELGALLASSQGIFAAQSIFDTRRFPRPPLTTQTKNAASQRDSAHCSRRHRQASWKEISARNQHQQRRRAK